MLKRLVIIAIAAFMAIGVSGQPNKATNPEKQDTKQGQSAMHAPDSKDKQSSGQTDQTKDSSNSPTGNATAERPPWWSTSDWWLVVIAGLTGCVIGWQSWETRKAANAANSNIQAVIYAERAWMLPKIDQPKYEDVLLLNEKAENWVLPIEVKITNRGQTPGIAVRAAYEYSSERIVDPAKESWILRLPEPPQYVNDPVPQAPGAIYASEEYMGLTLTVPKAFIEAEKPAWLRQEKCLCVRGFLEYRDAFKEPRISRFCYCFQDIFASRGWERDQIKPGPAPYRFRKAGPDAYNEIT